MQEIEVSDADMLGGGGEFLAGRDFGVGIGLEEIRRAVGGKAEIDAGVPIQLKCLVDALGGALDAGDGLGRQILGRPVQDLAALLIVGDRA